VLYEQTSDFSTMINLDEGFDGSPNQTKEAIHKYFETSEQIPTFGNFYVDHSNSEYFFR